MAAGLLIELGAVDDLVGLLQQFAHGEQPRQQLVAKRLPVTLAAQLFDDRTIVRSWSKPGSTSCSPIVTERPLSAQSGRCLLR